MMGKFKEIFIDAYDIPITEGNPFTHEELERFQMEEEMQRNDEREMEEELSRSRDILTKELRIVLMSLQEDSNTRKYSSYLCSDSIERVARILSMIEGGQIW